MKNKSEEELKLKNIFLANKILKELNKDQSFTFQDESTLFSDEFYIFIIESLAYENTLNVKIGVTRKDKIENIRKILTFLTEILDMDLSYINAYSIIYEDDRWSVKYMLQLILEIIYVLKGKDENENISIKDDQYNILNENEEEAKIQNIKNMQLSFSKIEEDEKNNSCPLFNSNPTTEFENNFPLKTSYSIGDIGMCENIEIEFGNISRSTNCHSKSKIAGIKQENKSERDNKFSNLRQKYHNNENEMSFSQINLNNDKSNLSDRSVSRGSGSNKSLSKSRSISKVRSDFSASSYNSNNSKNSSNSKIQLMPNIAVYSDQYLENETPLSENNIKSEIKKILNNIQHINHKSISKILSNKTTLNNFLEIVISDIKKIKKETTSKKENRGEIYVTITKEFLNDKQSDIEELIILHLKTFQLQEKIKFKIIKNLINRPTYIERIETYKYEKELQKNKKKKEMYRIEKEKYVENIRKYNEM